MSAVMVCVGRFVKTPEIRLLPNGTECTEFSLAINERRKTKDNSVKQFTHYFDFVAYSSASTTICKWCTKGDMIFVTCSPRQDRWQNSEGQNRSKIVFRIDNFKFISVGKKTESENDVQSPENIEENVDF